MCYDNEQSLSNLNTSCRGHDRMIVGQLPMQSVPITTEVVRLYPFHGEVYTMQLYMIKFLGNLRQVGALNIINNVKKYTIPHIPDSKLDMRTGIHSGV
jgi:hypothetical protein